MSGDPSVRETFLHQVRDYVEHATEPPPDSEAAVWLDWPNARLGLGASGPPFRARTPRERLVDPRGYVVPADAVLEVAEAHADLVWGSQP